MTLPRRMQVSVEDTPYYHCVSRCVRRAFLCGDDAYCGRNFSHRKAWVKERLAALAHVFAVDICAYAVMSNHYHLVVYIDRARAMAWTDDEVIERWRRLFKAPSPIDRYLGGETLNAADEERVSIFAATWRERLMSLSWYMRCLNEWLARRANAEDDCTGRFWEGRFKCQALLDEPALVTAMAYVDLNPVRAGVARDLYASTDTSVQQRLMAVAGDPAVDGVPLRDFGAWEREDGPTQVPFNIQDYLVLVDWTGRVVRSDKSGTLSASAPFILDVLGLDAREWVPTVTALRRRFELVIGSPDRMRRRAVAKGQRFHRGYRLARKLYCSRVADG